MKRTFASLLATSLFCALSMTAQAGSDAIRLEYGELPLGAFSHSKWVNINDMATGKANVPMIRKGDTFNLYHFNGKIGTGTITSVEKDANDSILYTVKSSNSEYKNTPLLAVDKSYNVIPRPIEKLPTNNAVYLDVVKKILVSKGLTKAKPHIVQLFRGDINNNGQNEIVIVATNITDEDSAWDLSKAFSEYGVLPGAPAQSYSMVIIRQIEGGVRNRIIDEYITMKHTGPDVADWKPPYLHRVEAFADLNGDGHMEIILCQKMYEGLEYDVYQQQRNSNWKPVLSNAFGA